jgi:hypothetical protein
LVRWKACAPSRKIISQVAAFHHEIWAVYVLRYLKKSLRAPYTVLQYCRQYARSKPSMAPWLLPQCKSKVRTTERRAFKRSVLCRGPATREQLLLCLVRSTVDHGPISQCGLLQLMLAQWH